MKVSIIESYFLQIIGSSDPISKKNNWWMLFQGRLFNFKDIAKKCNINPKHFIQFNSL